VYHSAFTRGVIHIRRGTRQIRITPNPYHPKHVCEAPDPC
jgi:hypothetical protein